MKTLYIVRHAKSSWGNLNQDDFDRTLNERGKRDLPFMAEKLKDLGVIPQMIISSPAKRALMTSKGLAEGIGYDPDKIEWHENIYESSAEEMLKSIETVDDEVDELMIVGHNPSVTFLVQKLCGEYLMKYSTCGVFAIEFDSSSWKNLSDGRKLFWIYPKLYND